MTRPQSVLDALVDAETLRLFALERLPAVTRSHRRRKGFGSVPVLREWRPWAHNNAGRIRRALRQIVWPLDKPEEAARAAFRACPGLRG